MQQIIFSQEQAHFDVSTGALTVGLAMVGPTLMTWGRPEQQDRHLEPMLRGEEMWCQLFSEPAAGSDLPVAASPAPSGTGTTSSSTVRRCGRRWPSTATGPSCWHGPTASVPGRRGLSYLLVDMTTPGIDVRPLRQITGVAHFNEVFLTDVRVPAANLVGAEGEGWNVARTTLAAERMAIGSGRWHVVRRRRGALPGTGRRATTPCGARRWPRRTSGSSSCATSASVSRRRSPRAVPPAPRPPSSSWPSPRQSARLGDLGVALLGPSGTASDGRVSAAGFWRDRFLGQWSTRIGGGTDEIQRNQIGERVLGLPREPSDQIQYPT